MNRGDNSRFLPVCHPGTSIEAGMIREALEQAGVNFYIQNENFAAIRTITGIGAGTVTVMVPENEVERAKEIIAGIGSI